MILSDGCMCLIEFEGGGRTGADMNSLFLEEDDDDDDRRY